MAEHILNVVDPATTLRLRTELLAAVVPLMGVGAVRAEFRAGTASSFGRGMRSLTSYFTGRGCGRRFGEFSLKLLFSSLLDCAEGTGVRCVGASLRS